MSRISRLFLILLVTIHVVLSGGSFTSPIVVNASDILPGCEENVREAVLAELAEERILREILEKKQSESGALSLQAWADNEIALGAGVSTDWYAYVLAEYYPKINLEKYAEKLLEYIKDNVSTAVSEQKYALCLVAAGPVEEGSKNAQLSESDLNNQIQAYLEEVCDRTVGQQGIMSLIYGLKLLDLGLPCSAYTTETLIDEILCQRLSDGGWAVFGTVSDVDVTAMCLQSLAKHIERDEVRAAVDEALDMLSDRQEENGGFKSFGASNPESSDQVIIALSELGIDYKSDSRFVKNGRTILDAVLEYRTDSGEFEHELGRGANSLATLQTAMACSAYCRYRSENGSQSAEQSEEPGVGQNVSQSEEQITEQTEGLQGAQSNQPDKQTVEDTGIAASVLHIKTLIALIILAFLAVALIICAVLHKGRKSYIFTVAIGAAALALVSVLDIQTASEYYSGSQVSETQISVNIKIDTSVVDGGMSEFTELSLPANASAYDALVQLAKTQKLPVETTGSGMSVYVRGINYIYEFDHGDLSGWMFEVNGEIPNVGSAAYPLNDGDELVWFYTKSMGHDRE